MTKYITLVLLLSGGGGAFLGAAEEAKIDFIEVEGYEQSNDGVYKLTDEPRNEWGLHKFLSIFIKKDLPHNPFTLVAGTPNYIPLVVELHKFGPDDLKINSNSVRARCPIYANEGIDRCESYYEHTFFTIRDLIKHISTCKMDYATQDDDSNHDPVKYKVLVTPERVTHMIDANLPQLSQDLLKYHSNAHVALYEQ